MKSIIHLIETLKATNIETVSLTALGGVETTTDIAQIERARNITLPDDYKTAMTTQGPFDLSGPDTNIILFSVHEINNAVLNDMGKLGNIFVFGSDNGGNYYFYDIDNVSGKGSYSIHDIYPGNPEWKHCTYLASDFTTLLDKIAKGE